MMSSTRLRNSGRKWCRSSFRTARSTTAHASSSAVRAGVHDVAAADVARHDDDGVPEIHHPALAVGQAPVVEDLQQDVEDVGVGLLDLVEEDHAVGPAPHRLGQLPALLVADVARRRADHPRHRVLLHVLRHVEPDDGALVVEEELGQRARRLGLADAGGPQEDERAGRPVGILQPRPAPPHGVGHGRHRLRLADDPLGQLVLEPRQPLALRLHHPRHRDAGPLRHDLGDVVGVHLFLQVPGAPLDLLRAGPPAPAELRLQLRDPAIAELGRLLEVAPPGGQVHLGPELVHLGARRLQLADGRLLGLPLRLHAGALLLQLGDLLLDRLRRALPALSFSFSSACRSISSCTMPALDLVDLLRAGCRSRCGAGSRPRPPGRSPCPGRNRSPM